MADNLPQITETGKAAISQFVDSLVDNAPSLGASATKIIITLVSELIQGIPEILDVGKQFVQGLIEGIKQESPQIGSLLEGIFDGFTSVIRARAGSCSESGTQDLRCPERRGSKYPPLYWRQSERLRLRLSL